MLKQLLPQIFEGHGHRAGALIGDCGVAQERPVNRQGLVGHASPHAAKPDDTELTDCISTGSDCIVGHPESAGINRDVVGDERSPPGVANVGRNPQDEFRGSGAERENQSGGGINTAINDEDCGVAVGRAAR